MIEELLEALLTGGQPAATGGRAAPEQSASNNPMMALLEAFLGGAAMGGGQQPAASLDFNRLLEVFMGGGSQGSVAAHPMLAPFVEALAEKLGISPQLAATIVSYAFSLIVANFKEKTQSGAAPQDAQGSPNLDHLLEGDFLEASGLVAQLTRDTGLDPAAARDSLRTAVALLSGRTTPTAPPVQQPSSGSSQLQHLLDEW